jgi:amidase
MTDSDLCFLPARELVRLIRSRALSAREVTEAHLRQVERFNPTVNAIVTLVPEMALAAASEADAMLGRNEPVGPLHGLPMAHKDMTQTKGIRTTYGSPLLAEFVPQQDSLVIERLRAAGVVTIGKTNVPEFGAGSQTYNTIFGETRNPYDTTKTCGGSSGGAAVALACGMMPLADGGDQGGSLRNPAGFCNVVGMRPSPGRVPSWPTFSAWSTLGVDGPMARTVADTALLLDAIAGPDPRSPISIHDGARFDRSLERDFNGVRIAWSRNLGGLPVDPRVTSVIESQRGTFASLGCVIDEVEPDFQGRMRSSR